MAEDCPPPLCCLLLWVTTMTSIEALDYLCQLVNTANPDLALPLNSSNVGITMIGPSDGHTRNTVATLVGLAINGSVGYRGNLKIHYDRENISRYWNNAVIEKLGIDTVVELVNELNQKYGLSVQPYDLANGGEQLPSQGNIKIVIAESASLLYTGSTTVTYYRDAAYLGTSGVDYDIVIANGRSIIGYVETVSLGDRIEISVDGGVWEPITPVRQVDGMYVLSKPGLVVGRRNVRIRGAVVCLKDRAGVYVPIVRLNRYKGLTEASDYCSNILTLVEVSEDVFEHRRDLIGADRMFKNCINLSTIPDNLFEGQINLLSLEECFYNTGIEKVPSGLLHNCGNLRNVEGMLAGCVLLQDIPTGLFNTTPRITNAARLLASTTGVTGDVIGNILSPLKELVNADYIFAGSLPTTIVPTTTFANNRKLTSLNGAFSYTNISRIEPGLFSTLENLVEAAELFRGCDLLTTLPASVFGQNPNIEVLDRAFEKTGLLSVPATLFSRARRVVTMDHMFAGCTKITSIPANLLKSLLRLRSIAGLWSDCTGVTGVPQDALSANRDLVTASYLFAGTKLSAIPAGLFNNNPKLVELDGVFSRTMVNSVPIGLFSSLPILATVKGCFENSALTTVPGNIFHNDTKVDDLERFISDCRNLVGDVVDLFNSNPTLSGKVKRVSGLYQGNVLMTGTFADLRSTLSSVSWNDDDAVKGIVAGLSRLTDYSQIGTVYKTRI